MALDVPVVLRPLHSSPTKLTLDHDVIQSILQNDTLMGGPCTEVDLGVQGDTTRHYQYQTREKCRTSIFSLLWDKFLFIIVFFRFFSNSCFPLIVTSVYYHSSDPRSSTLFILIAQIRLFLSPFCGPSHVVI